MPRPTLYAVTGPDHEGHDLPTQYVVGEEVLKRCIAITFSRTKKPDEEFDDRTGIYRWGYSDESEPRVVATPIAFATDNAELISTAQHL